MSRDEAEQRARQLHVELWTAIAAWALFPPQDTSVSKQKAVVAVEEAFARYAAVHVLDIAHVHKVVAESVRKTLHDMRTEQEIYVKHPRAPISDRSDENFAAGALTTRVMIAFERTLPVLATDQARLRVTRLCDATRTLIGESFAKVNPQVGNDATQAVMEVEQLLGHRQKS